MMKLFSGFAWLALCCFSGSIQAEELVIPPVTSGVKSKFVNGSIEYSGGSYDQKVFHYRLYVPPESLKSDNASWPLIVWLHGNDEAGDDNAIQLTWFAELLFDHSQQPELPCYVLAFQCPLQAPSWTSGETDQEHPLSICKAIVDQLQSTHPIDEERILLSGVSSGGTACWEALARYPSLFAAAAPLAASGYQGDLTALLRATKTTPVWAFHTLRDPVTPIDTVRQTIDTLSQNGGKAYLTTTVGATHDSWTAAFRDFNLFNWLMSQRRGKDSRVPRYWTFGNWWKLERQEGDLASNLLVPAVAGIILAAWMGESRRRTKATSNARHADSGSVS